MRRTELLQEIRQARFEEAHAGWRTERLTQADAASLLGRRADISALPGAIRGVGAGRAD